MDRHPWFVVPLACALLLTSACASVPEDADPAVGVTAAAVEYENALNANALNANALNANALNANALSAGALDFGHLGAAARAAITDPGPTGDLSRQLLRYTVSCALAPAQAFAFSWTDPAGVLHAEVYPGLLGLASGWLRSAPAVKQQEFVSACLASRANWYGVPVTISSRGTPRALATSPAELTAYPELEGAFWGNLFSATPHLRACHYPSGDANARARLRDCAAGHLTDLGSAIPCGMIRLVGACSTVCDPMASGSTYYPGCAGDPASGDTWTNRVVTTYLP